MGRWVKDDKIRANFLRLGIKLEERKVPVSKIDWVEGLRKQTRLIGKLKDDYVLQIAEAWLQPESVLPMIVLVEPKHGMLYPCDGNHRGAGVMLATPEIQEIDAYICPEPRDALIKDIIHRVPNMWGSLGSSTEEKVIQARWFIEKHNMASKEAAAMCGLKVDQIYKANASASVKEALVEVGVKVDKLAKVICEKLHVIENRNVMRLIAETVIKHKVNNTDAIHIITDVRVQRTEMQQIGEINRWDKMLEARKPTKKEGKKPVVQFSTHVRKAFIRHLTGLEKILLKCDTIEKLQLTGDPTQMLLAERTSKTIVQKLSAILGGK